MKTTLLHKMVSAHVATQTNFRILGILALCWIVGFLLIVGVEWMFNLYRGPRRAIFVANAFVCLIGASVAVLSIWRLFR